MTDDYPNPLSDAETEGFPGTADDDSTAYDDVEAGREADGPAPASLPGDRDRAPVAMDRYGTTSEEARIGESLDYKLEQEQPEVTPDEPMASPAPGLADEAIDQDSADKAPTDSDIWAPGPEPDKGQVSEYDRPGLEREVDTPIGRLVGPEGAPTAGDLESDREDEAIATDAGAAGGGASAEELAIHEIPEGFA